MQFKTVFPQTNCMLQVRKTATAIVLLAGLAGCYQPVQPDSTPPKLYILKFEPKPDGTEGSQTSVAPGGQFAVSSDWLGFTQAYIRVYGESPHGVRKFTVYGSAQGTCRASGPNSTTAAAPDPLFASFPPHTEIAPPGSTSDFMAFTLGPSILQNNSCGWKAYGIGPPLEYFLSAPAIWTITATAENGSGIQTKATFTIILQ
jgi:hypothetical protein